MQCEQNRHKDIYDKAVHGDPYSPGDRVWLHCPAVPRGRCRKFHRPWKGPFSILKQIGYTCFRIRDDQHPRRRFVVHFNRLRPYYDPPNDHSSMDPEEVVVPEHDISPDNTTTNESATEHSKMADNVSDNTEDDLTGETSDLEENETSPSQSPVLRRSSRTRRPPTRYGECISYNGWLYHDKES